MRYMSNQLLHYVKLSPNDRIASQNFMLSVWPWAEMFFDSNVEDILSILWLA
jgi:hypothetical protein